MRRAPRPAALAALLALAAASAARGEPYLYQVDAPDSTLTASLDAVDEKQQGLTPSGHVDAETVLALDAVEGLVVSSLEITSAAIGIDGTSFALAFGPHVSLAATSGPLLVDGASPVLLGTVVGPNTTTFDLSGQPVLLVGGTLDLDGSALGQSVDESHDLAATPLSASLPAGTVLTAHVQPGPGDPLVTLTLPLDVLVRVLDDPLVIPLHLSGTLELEGSPAPNAVPGLGPLAAVFAFALLLGAAAVRAALVRDRALRPADRGGR